MRPATINDAGAILEMMMAWYQENQRVVSYDTGFNSLKTRQWLEVALESPMVICYISDGGFIAALQNNTFWGDNNFVQGALFYVKPEFRNGLVARSLLRAVERETKERGLDWLVFSPQVRSDTSFLPEYMRRLGFQSMGVVFAKRIN